MKIRVFIAVVLAMLAIVSAPALTIAQRQGIWSVADQDVATRAKRFIVLLRDSAVGPNAVEPEVNAYGQYLSSLYGGRVQQVFSHAVRGYVSELTDAEASQLTSDPNVLSVEEDRIITVASTESNAPWHLDRIDQRLLPLDSVYNYSQAGANVNIYIIDTGVRYTHVDFGGRADAVYDNVGDGYNGYDCYGHGTHVAGLAGSNTYGVAKAAKIHSVRVVGCSGATYMSNMLDGIDWVTANHSGPSVANISLQLGGASYSLETALANSVASGVVYTVAAGNSNADACNFTPSRAPSAITVAATDPTDSKASYSNFGACVDVFAPGTSLTSLSYLNDTDTRVLSGTSMASPVVAGIAALYLGAHPSASPSTVTNAIKSSATSGKLTNVDATTPNLLVYSPLTAVTTAKVKVQKVAQSSGKQVSSVFNYSAVNLDTPSFSLTDNTAYQDPNVNVSGTMTTITVTEAAVPGWALTGITCSEVSTGLPAVSDSTVDIAARTATIRAEPGEDITCTFTSQALAPTAATVTLSGRILSPFGDGIRGVRVSLVDTRTGRSSSAVSNAFGYYSFSNVQVGEPYAVTAVGSSRYTFSDPVRILTPQDAVSDLNFVADTR